VVFLLASPFAQSLKASRCRGNPAHIRQSRPDSGLGFQVKGRETSQLVPLPRWGWCSCWQRPSRSPPHPKSQSLKLSHCRANMAEHKTRSHTSPSILAFEENPLKFFILLGGGGVPAGNALRDTPRAPDRPDSRPRSHPGPQGYLAHKKLPPGWILQ